MIRPSDYGLRAQLPVMLDHQVTGTFLECERMCYYQHVLGRQTGNKFQADNFNLFWGKVMHEAIDTWLSSNDIDLVVAVAEQVPEVTEDRYGRDRSRFIEAFLEWKAYNSANPVKIISTEQPVYMVCQDTECPYSPTGCGLGYGGRMDRAVEWNNLAGPLDLKTTVMDEADPAADYRPSHQMMGYVWQFSHLMGKHSWGIIVEKLVCNKSALKVNRFPVSFSRDNIREWVQNEKQAQQRLRSMAHLAGDDESAWLMNMARCNKPYPCTFRDVCMMPTDMGFRYKWLANNTTERRWDFSNPDGVLKYNAEVPIHTGSDGAG